MLKSFYSLAKSNNGIFKSEKQKDFLLAQCDSMMCFRSSANASFSFGVDGNVNQSYDVLVQCDAVGVVSITHIGGKTRKEKVFFTRMSEEQLQAKEAIKAQEWAEYDEKMTLAAKREFKRKLYNKQLDKLANIAITKKYRSDSSFANRVDSLFVSIETKLNNL